MMGVIFTEGDDVNNLLIPYLRTVDLKFRPSKLREIYVRASAGEITSQEFWHQLGFASQYPKIEQEFLENSFTLDPEIKTIAGLLKEKYHLGILSNDLSEWSRFLRKKYALDPLFDVAIISGEVGCRKPDRRIFEILLQHLGDAAQNCIFIDDKRINLATAREVGFSTIQFIRGNSGVEASNYAAPHFQIRSFSELPILLGSLG